MPTTDKQAVREAHPKRTTRIRLESETRKELILDAALLEFSTRGYTSTRIDDIATRAGLSKGGLYAHFASKETVFEALLRRSLAAPTFDIDTLLKRSSSTRELSKQLAETLYTPLHRPAVLATLRILFTEGHRLPDVVADWRRDNLHTLHAHLERLFCAAIAQGICRDSIVCRKPWLILSPIIHLVMQRLALETMTTRSLKQAQREHVEMLCELLEPCAVDAGQGDQPPAKRRRSAEK
ncbi:TetR/AcrR family transcriptional regulator [Cupriavidus basilensis]